MKKIILKDALPPEGFRSAENKKFYIVEKNWYAVTEFIQGSTLWGLPVVSGTTKRAEHFSSAVDRGDLFSATGKLQLPSGGIVKFETSPYDRIWVGEKYTEIEFNEKDEEEVLEWFSREVENEN